MFIFSGVIYSYPDFNLRPKMGFSEKITTGADETFDYNKIAIKIELGIEWKSHRGKIAMAIMCYKEAVKEHLGRDALNVVISKFKEDGSLEQRFDFSDQRALLGLELEKSDVVNIDVEGNIPRNILVYIMANVKKALEEGYYITGKHNSVSILCNLLDGTEDNLPEDIKKEMEKISGIVESARGNRDEI